MEEFIRMRRRGQSMTPEEVAQAQTTFLKTFRANANTRLAAQAAGVHRSTIYSWLEKDEQFAIEYHDAEKDANDVVRAAIFQRAVVGVEEPVIAMGHVMYDKEGQMLTVKRYSDALLMRLAQARMPEYRNEQKVEHTGSIAIDGAKETLLAKLVEHGKKDVSDLHSQQG